MPARTTAASSRSSSARSSRAVPPVRRRRSPRRWTISAEIVRWILALVMQLVGVTMLIGLTIQGGSLTDWERNAVAPWFGTARWLLPLVLILLGYYLERVQADHWDWELTLVGSALGFLSLQGLLGPHRPPPERRDRRPRDRPFPRTARDGARGRRHPHRPHDRRRAAGGRHVAAGGRGAARAPGQPGHGRPVPAGRRGPGERRDPNRERRLRRTAPPEKPGRTAARPTRTASATTARRRSRRGTERRADVGHLRPADRVRQPRSRAAPWSQPGHGRRHFRSRRRHAPRTSPRHDRDGAVQARRCGDIRQGARRIPAAAAVAARRRRPADRRDRHGPRAQRRDHRGEAGQLQHPGPSRDLERRPRRDPVRGRAVARDQGLSHRGPVRRPGDGPGRPNDPHRGPDPGQERGRARDPEQGLQHRRPAADPRGSRLPGHLQADLRPRPRRGRPRPGRRPGQDAAPADRRRHRLGQERHGQRPDHEPAVQRHSGRGRGWCWSTSSASSCRPTTACRT